MKCDVSFSLCSLSTVFRWGGHFCHVCVRHFFLLTTVQKILFFKSIKIFQSYDHKCTAAFLWFTVYIRLHRGLHRQLDSDRNVWWRIKSKTKRCHIATIAWWNGDYSVHLSWNVTARGLVVFMLKRREKGGEWAELFMLMITLSPWLEFMKNDVQSMSV